MTVALGKSCALAQRSYGEWDGLYLMSGVNLYPGTLNVTAGKEKMRCVLTLPLEEYLLGVVPFEMGDGPIEALKAQAVCARTYALKHISSSRDYDVYDNSEDQNFGGIPSRTSRAAIQRHSMRQPTSPISASTALMSVIEYGGRMCASVMSGSCTRMNVSAAVAIATASAYQVMSAMRNRRQARR